MAKFTVKLDRWPCYDFKWFRQSSTVIGSKVQCQMSLEECKSWTCIVLLGFESEVQVEESQLKTS